MNKYHVLVNKDKPIAMDYYYKEKLVKAKNIEDETILIDKKTYRYYLKLKKELEKFNIIIAISSAFRAIEHQQELYEEFIIKYGSDLASKLVALPKTSEHHTGLAIDIVLKSMNYDIDYKTIYENEGEYLQIYNVLPKYGFILRYPKNKEHITKYNYEPWHIRFVGKALARTLFINNITLEEYYQNKNICVKNL